MADPKASLKMECAAPAMRELNLSDGSFVIAGQNMQLSVLNCIDLAVFIDLLTKEGILDTFESRKLLSLIAEQSISSSSRHLLSLICSKDACTQKSFIAFLSSTVEKIWHAAVCQGDEPAARKGSVKETADVSAEASVASCKKLSPLDQDPNKKSSAVDLNSTPPLKGIQRVFAEHGLKQDEVVQYTRVFPFINKLRQEDVLEADEFRFLLNTYQDKPNFEASRQLVTIISKKPVRIQQDFVHLLLSSQPQIRRISTMADDENSWQHMDPRLAVGKYSKTIVNSLEAQLRKWYQQLEASVDNPWISRGDPVHDFDGRILSLTHSQAKRFIEGGAHVFVRNPDQCSKNVSERQGKNQNVDDMVRTHDGRNTKRVLLLEACSTARSRFCFRVLLQWACYKVFRQFAIVFYISMRDHERSCTTSVASLLRLDVMGFKSPEQRSILAYLNKESHKVLLIVDSCTHDISQQQGSAVQQLFDGVLFPNASIIISAQPSLSLLQLTARCERHYCFQAPTDKLFTASVTHTLGGEASQTFLRKLQESSCLHWKSALEASPMMASLAMQLFKVKRFLPQCVSQLYYLSLHCQLKEYDSEKLRDGDSSYDTIPDIETLGKLALEDLLQRRLSFPKENLRLPNDTSLQDHGLISQVPQIGLGLGNESYTFVHDSWQKYLAARCLAQSEDVEMLAKCAAALGVGPETWLFWRFVAAYLPSLQLTELVYQLLQTDPNARKSIPFRCFLLCCIAEALENQENVASEPLQLAVEMACGRSSVSLSGYRFSLFEAKAIAKCLHRCPDIETLTVEQVDLSEEHWRFLAAGLRNLSSVVFVDAGSFPNESIDHVTRLLQRCSSLKWKHCDLSELGGRQLALSMRVTAVRELFLIDCQLTTHELRLLAMRLAEQGSLKTLEKLSLDQNDLHGREDCLCLLLALLPNLHELCVRNCNLTDKDVRYAVKEVASKTNLTLLDLSDNEITDNLFQPLTLLINTRYANGFRNGRAALRIALGGNEKLSCLRELALTIPADSDVAFEYDNYGVCGQGMYHLEAVQAADLLLRSSSSHVVFAHACGNQATVEIAGWLARNMTVLSLDMPDSHIGSAGAEALAGALIHNTSLTALSLANNSIGSVGFHSMMTAAASSRTLRVLNLARNNLFFNIDFDLWHVDCWKISTSLTVLCLSGTQMNDDTLDSCSNILFSVIQLSVLDLSKNNISDKGVSKFASVFPLQKTLTCLSLSDNCISNRGGRLLAEAIDCVLSANPRHPLECVAVGGNRLTDEFFQRTTCSIMLACKLSLASATSAVVLRDFTPPSFDLGMVQATKGSLANMPHPLSFTNFSSFTNMLTMLSASHNHDVFIRWRQRGFQCLSDCVPGDTSVAQLLSLHASTAKDCELRGDVLAAAQVWCASLAVANEHRLAKRCSEDAAQPDLIMSNLRRLTAANESLPIPAIIDDLAHRYQLGNCPLVAKCLKEQSAQICDTEQPICEKE